MRLRNIFGFIAALPALCLSGLVTAGEGEGWGHYGGSERGLQYSALSEINKDNVKRLTEVWRYRTGELGAGMSKPFAFEANIRKKNAEEGIARLKDQVDTLIVIDNDRLLQLNNHGEQTYTWEDALKMAD